MVIEVFKTKEEDKELVQTLVREANILLASHYYENEPMYNWYKERLFESINLMREFEAIFPTVNRDAKYVIELLNKIWDKQILSPLALTDEEFEEYDATGVSRNIRNKSICRINGVVYNQNAYKITTRACYSEDLKCILNTIVDTLDSNPRLYIYKGGVITGKYIEKCIIREEVVDKHLFSIQSVVNIPVSSVIRKNEKYFIVDHREPKLKVLREFYDVPIYLDEEVANYKIDIRKYKKS